MWKYRTSYPKRWKPNCFPKNLKDPYEIGTYAQEQSKQIFGKLIQKLQYVAGIISQIWSVFYCRFCTFRIIIWVTFRIIQNIDNYRTISLLQPPYAEKPSKNQYIKKCVLFLSIRNLSY